MCCDIDMPPAQWNGALEVLRVLLAHGADVNSRNERGDTPLHSLAEGCYDNDNNEFIRDILRILLTNGAYLNAEDDYGFTPLHVAAIMRKAAMAELLIENGADRNVKDNKGKTPKEYYLNPENCKLLFDS